MSNNKVVISLILTCELHYWLTVIPRYSENKGYFSPKKPSPLLLCFILTKLTTFKMGLKKNYGLRVITGNFCQSKWAIFKSYFSFTFSYETQINIVKNQTKELVCVKQNGSNKEKNSDERMRSLCFSPSEDRKKTEKIRRFFDHTLLPIGT